MELHSHSTSTVKRRRPNQERSKDKLELIFEASIRILNKQGLSNFTTNSIAELAGISIGTLYQYFSNKQEILIALGEREIELTLAKVHVIFNQQLEDAGLVSDKLRLLIRAMLNAFDGRHRVRKILLEVAMTQQGLSGLEQPIKRIGDFLSSWATLNASHNKLLISELDIFVLTNAVTGVIRAALMQDADNLSKIELEDRLVLLVRSYLLRLPSSDASD